MNRPRPVLTAAGYAGVLQGVVLVLTFLGYSGAAGDISAQSQTLISVALGVGSLVFHLVPHVISQEKVTPISDPKLTLIAAPSVEQTLPPAAVDAVPAADSVELT